MQVQGGRSDTSYGNLVTFAVTVAEFVYILFSITFVRVMPHFPLFFPLESEEEETKLISSWELK